MAWEAVEFGNMSTIGTNLEYNKEQRLLKVKLGGSYFVQFVLQFNSTALSSVRSRVEVTLKADSGTLLSCGVDLTNLPVTKMCWNVALNVKSGSRLSVEMTHNSKMEKVFGWKLLANSGFVIFLLK